jgi:hypothetical protein
MRAAPSSLLTKVGEIAALAPAQRMTGITRLRAAAASVGMSDVLQRELVAAGLCQDDSVAQALGSPMQHSRVSAMPGIAVRSLSDLASSAHLVSGDGGVIFAERSDSAPIDTGMTLASLSAASGITLQAASRMASSPYLWHIVTTLVSKTRERELRGVAEPNRHEIAGGEDGLRRFFSIRSKNADVDVFEMLRALQQLRVGNVDNAASLLNAYRRERPSMGRPAIFYVIEVGLLLRPAKAKQLGLSDRFDIPLVQPSMVPKTGYSSTRGRQINAVERLMVYAHDRRRSIHLEGSLSLTLDEWNGIASDAGLYERSHASARRKLFDKLQEPPECLELPYGRVANTPLLVKVDGKDRYAFGESFMPEWRHFGEQGAYSEHQSERQRAGALRRGRARSRARK